MHQSASDLNKKNIPGNARTSKTFSKSAIPEKCIRMMLSKKELSDLPKNSTDVCKRNKVDRHLIKPKDEVFENLCYALFIK